LSLLFHAAVHKAAAKPAAEPADEAADEARAPAWPLPVPAMSENEPEPEPADPAHGKSRRLRIDAEATLDAARRSFDAMPRPHGFRPPYVGPNRRKPAPDGAPGDGAAEDPVTAFLDTEPEVHWPSESHGPPPKRDAGG
jgi:hypothetical protein